MNAKRLELSIRRSLQSGVRSIALRTREEERTVGLLEEIAEKLAWPVHVWSVARGTDNAGPTSLEDLLRKLLARRDDELWILLDPARALTEAIPSRLLRDLSQRTGGPAVVVVCPRVDWANEVPEIVVESLSLPDLDELGAQLDWIAARLEEGGHENASSEMGAFRERIARAALGLPSHVVDRLVAEGVSESGVDPERIEAWIALRKPDVLDANGLLEHVDPVPMGELGGLAAYKRWLEARKRAFAPEARCAGIPAPRGAMLIGVQGCGKSLAARATAHELGLHLLRLDPGRLFGGTVGESEENLRRTLAIVDRMAPLVLWLDEIEKGLAGSDGAASDAGTTARVVGGLLTWLQERSSPVFVVATANDVSRLPPELIRRGRLDELFFVDLPGPEERVAILDVHLSIRPEREFGVVPPTADAPEAFATLARAADGFSGAELQAALIEARLASFAESRPVAAADLSLALEATVPLSKSHAEQIGALRTWARTRTRPASGKATR